MATMDETATVTRETPHYIAAEQAWWTAYPEKTNREFLVDAHADEQRRWLRVGEWVAHLRQRAYAAGLRHAGPLAGGGEGRDA